MEDGSTLSLLTPYPINSIYMAETETSPASIFGGEWERIEKRFLLGHGSGNTLGQVGGEENVTLTIDTMPNHNHYRSYNGYSFLVDLNRKSGDGFDMLATGGNEWKYAAAESTAATGGGQAHNNMPPYYVVNIWKRVA